MNVKDESGFTIQELLVVMMVGSLLIGFGYSLLQFSWKVKRRFEVTQAERIDLLRSAHTLATDMQRMSRILEANPSGIVLESVRGDTVRYELDSTKVMRNEVAIARSVGGGLKVSVVPEANGLWLIHGAEKDPGSGFQVDMRINRQQSSRKKFEDFENRHGDANQH